MESINVRDVRDIFFLLFQIMIFAIQSYIEIFFDKKNSSNLHLRVFRSVHVGEWPSCYSGDAVGFDIQW